MSLVSFTIQLLEKLVMSVASRSLADAVKDLRTKRRMERLVGDAVDTMAAQLNDYLTAEHVNESRAQLLLQVICDEIQTVVETPRQFFSADLDGQRLFARLYPDNAFPVAIRNEQLDQLFAVLFPQIAHLIAGSEIALQQWRAEGFREEFKRLREIADEVSAVSAKLSAVGAQIDRLDGGKNEKAEGLLRSFTQTLLNRSSLTLDLSPLRADRTIRGTLNDNFVCPAFLEEDQTADGRRFETTNDIMETLVAPGGGSIIHGGPGVGKSTWAIWAQQQILQSRPPRVAIVVRLRTSEHLETQSLRELLQSQAGPHLRGALTEEVISSWKQNSRLVIFFDGFDEVPETRRDQLEQWLRDLHATEAGVSIVVTSRPLHSGHLTFGLRSKWRYFTLQPFDRGRIVTFIRLWHKNLNELGIVDGKQVISAEDLSTVFMKDESIRPLTDTPLMLGTLLFVHHRDGALPSGRVNLYDRYIAAMLGLRDSGLGINARSTNLTDMQKRRVLAAIALRFHLNQRNEVDDEMMSSILVEIFQKLGIVEDPARVLAAFCERTGLLIGPGTWSFVHRTVAEFLVAELIQDGTTFVPDGRRMDRDRLWAERNSDVWMGVIFFWAGKTTVRELIEFIERLLTERTHEATQLAVALLFDQGDRLEFAKRRELCYRSVTLPLSRITQVIRSTTFASTVFCPEEYFVLFESPNLTLPGLSLTPVAKAITEWLNSGLLLPSDIQACHSDFEHLLIVCAFRSLAFPSSRNTLKGTANISKVGSEKAALLSFGPWMRKHAHALDVSDDQLNTAVDQWSDVFPDFREAVVLLLIGEFLEAFFRTKWNDARARRSLITRLHLIWCRRNDSIDKQWLRASVRCRGAVIPRYKDDLLKEFGNALKRLKADVEAGSGSPIDNLMKWSDDLALSRRHLPAN